MMESTRLNRIWKLLCSLKLAIVLASATTLLIMGGSLLMPFNPRIFAGMDQLTLGEWLRTAGASQPAITWWVYAACTLILLLGFNTLCCFIDWLRNVRSRWRKSGEYLIHLGFILILAGYVWGSLAGFRNEGTRLAVGEIQEITGLPGYALRLDAFEPQLGAGGRPIDMLSTVTLLREGRTLQQTIVRSNEPLIHDGLVIVPASFGRQPAGFTFLIAGRGTVELTPGSEVELGGGRRLRVLEFFPDAYPQGEGQAGRRGDQLDNPAIRLEMIQPGRENWQGWYFLRNGIPFPLLEAGVRLWPTEPVYRLFSELTINHDPGAPLAGAGAVAMLAGVLLAAGSYYNKRSRGDRPDVV